jgi:hypothetical protein
MNMNTMLQLPDADKYARSVRASKAVRWDIEKDVIKGRHLDVSRKFMPDGLTLIQEATFLSDPEKRFAGQVQGRTYANIFGLVERFITAKFLEIGRDHWLGDQNALEALVRFSDEELKHQALFRRVDDMMGEILPAGYRFNVDRDQVARAVLDKSTWAVLVLTLHIELFVQNHYIQSIEPDGELSPLFKDVFLFHWKDECQHVVLDELELKRHDAGLAPDERDRGVDDFIALVQAVDGILRAQVRADVTYFAAQCGRSIPSREMDDLAGQFLKAYRWQYIFSGATHPRFQGILKSLISPAQFMRIEAALGALDRSAN